MTGEAFIHRTMACCWWLLCGNPATTTRKHPVLGDVPICDRCDDKVRRIEGGDQ